MKTSALTKNSIANAVESGMNICTWVCQGAEGNEPMIGVCRFFRDQDGIRCERISGDDLTKGGFTSDGYLWLADYDHIVFGQISKEEDWL